MQSPVEAELIDLDHAATTPLDPELGVGLLAREATASGNPDSPHPRGRAAAALLEGARATLAELLGARPAEVVFTGGGTEALGLALIGHGVQVAPGGAERPRIAVSAVEHAAVREAAAWLARHRDWVVDTVPVDAWGRVSPAALAERVNRHTRLVAVMLANNEIGTVNPVAEVAAVVRAQAPRARLVVDAVQAFGKRPFAVGDLGADAVAITAHKIHGPKHIGALWTRRPATALLRGGGQQDGQRGGTLSAPLAWAFAEAARRHLPDMPQIRALRDRLWAGLRTRLPEVVLTGAPFGPERLDNNLHLRVPGLPGGPLLNALGAAGVCASAGSACHGDRFSPVLQALGHRPEEGAWLRLCPGRFTTEVHIDAAVARIAAAVVELRALLPAGPAGGRR